MKHTLIFLFALAALPSFSQTALTQTTATTTTTTAETPKPGKMKEYTGSYSFADGSPVSTFMVIEKNGLIYGEADSYGSFKLEKQPETDTYKSTSSYGSIIVFSRNPATKSVISLTLKVQGQELIARKSPK